LLPTIDLSIVRIFEEEGNCIVCLEMRADELMRHLISGELTNYRVVRTSPEPLHQSTNFFLNLLLYLLTMKSQYGAVFAGLEAFRRTVLLV
jgi:hypothetical protein